MPPNLRTFVPAPFGDAERARLTAWLAQAEWPRGHMKIAELEGYLVALIAWPVGLPSGAWLPLIWGLRGWKVPSKIAAHSEYDEFVALIIGFLHELDARLSRQSSRFESSVLRGLHGPEQVEALHCWGRGFMTALTLVPQGLKERNEAAIAAVHTIVGGTSASAPFRAQLLEEVVSAVAALMEQRVSRGPLGPLP